MHAILRDRPDFKCVPICLHDDLEPYAKLNMRVIIQKVNNHVNPELTSEEAFEREQTRLDEFCKRNKIKVLDDIRSAVAMADRFNFNRNMTTMLQKQSHEIANKFKMPVSIEFDNQQSIGSVDDRVAAYRQQAAEASLEFPVLLKLQVGHKAKYSHIFYCVNDEVGLAEALGFEGFLDSNILCQAYVPHKERVYKIYGIGSWFK